MHIFVRTLCLILFVAQHSVFPFMSLFFKYLGLSPLYSGIIRCCQSWLPVVANLLFSLMKNCNSFFPKRRTLIYLLIFINIGVHTCLIFIPPSAPTDIMHCLVQFTDTYSVIREQSNYNEPSVTHPHNNYFFSSNKRVPNVEFRYKNNDDYNQIYRNETTYVAKTRPSKQKPLDNKSAQKVSIPIIKADNSMFYAISSDLMEQSIQKDGYMKMNSPVTSQQIHNGAEKNMINSNSPYDKSEKFTSNNKITPLGEQNLVTKGDQLHKNDQLEKFGEEIGHNHAISSNNYKDNLLTSQLNYAITSEDPFNMPSDSTLSDTSGKVKLKTGEHHQQSEGLSMKSMFHKKINDAVFDVDKLYGSADNFLSASRENEKNREMYQQSKDLTTVSAKSVQTEINNEPKDIFFNVFFKNQKQNFRPFHTLKEPKKMLNIKGMSDPTTPISVEKETSDGVRKHNIRSRSIARSVTENSKTTLKEVKRSENISSFGKTVDGAHYMIKDKFTQNTTFSNLYVTFTFSLTLEFMHFASSLLIENMYSLNIMNVLYLHRISFPIWALIICPILLIGSLLCPCPFQIATHFVVATAVLLIGMLLLICVPVDVTEIYTMRKRKNSKPIYKSESNYKFHQRIFSSLTVSVIGFLTACNSEFIMWHFEEDSTFSSNYEFIYCGYIMTSFLIHFITKRMWKQYKLVGEDEKEDDDSEEWEPQTNELKDVEQFWPRLVGLASLATQMLLLPFLQPVWLLALVSGILQGLTESFVLSRKGSYKAGYGTGCFVAGTVVQVSGTRVLFLSASVVTLVFILILLVSKWLSRFFCNQSRLSKLSAIPNYDSEETEEAKTEDWLERALQEEQYCKAKLQENTRRLQQSVAKAQGPETTEDWLERAMQDEEYFKAKLQKSCKLNKSVSFH